VYAGNVAVGVGVATGGDGIGAGGGGATAACVTGGGGGAAATGCSSAAAGTAKRPAPATAMARTAIRMLRARRRAPSICAQARNTNVPYRLRGELSGSGWEARPRPANPVDGFTPRTTPTARTRSAPPEDGFPVPARLLAGAAARGRVRRTDHDEPLEERLRGTCPVGAANKPAHPVRKRQAATDHVTRG
jgi:hypothetical protein